MKNAENRIVFPLDMPSAKIAEEYVSLLSGYVGMFKVGLELFIRSGPDIIKFIRNSGEAKIFLDLKLHDIPATVSRAMAGVGELGVDFATVHCGESRKMLEHAVSGANGKVGVLGVTVLTSVSSGDICEGGFREEFSSDMSKLVMKRATMAKAAGCAGIVCSGLEAGMVKKSLGKNFLAVTPGIRPAWEGMEKNDQQRIATPAQAIRNGSDYLVIGRPIRDATDPGEAARRIAEEIEAAL